MKIIFSLLLIVFLGFSGYHLTFRGFKLPLFIDKFYLTGNEFLFLGILLGPNLLNILDTSTIIALEPVSTVLLGWIGLLFGFQFELKKLRRFPIEYLCASVIESFITIIVVYIGVYLSLSFISQYIDIPVKLRLIISVFLSCASACTAQTGLALITPNFISKHGNIVKLLRYMSSIDGFAALIIFGILFILHSAFLQNHSFILNKFFLSAIISIVACIMLVIVCIMLVAQSKNNIELLLVVIGMTVLISGTASILNLSPLVTNFFIGICLVNFSDKKEQIFHILISIEKPIYLLVLIFLGAIWHCDSLFCFFIAAAYTFLRFIGKISGGFLIRYIGPDLKKNSPVLGFGLIAQGGLTMAILLDFYKGFPEANIAINIALVSVVYNEIISFPLLQFLIGSDQT